MTQTKVFIPEKGGHNFEPARRYGELIYVTEEHIHRLSTTNMLRAFVTALEGSSPDDYILVSGISTFSIIGAACFAFMHGRLNLLLYKADERKYITREFDLRALLERKDEDDESN